MTAFAKSAAADDAAGPPRVRWGIGATGGFAGANVLGTSANFGGGLYARLGYQHNDLLGFEAEAAGYTAIFTGVFRGALLVDLTPTPWFTVAAGPMTSYSGGGTDIVVAGGTLRLDFHLLSSRTQGGARKGLTIGIGGDVGYGGTTIGDGLGYGANFYVGYSHY